MEHKQLVRLRDDINAVLHDPGSSLYLIGDKSNPHRADPPEGFDCDEADFESPFDPS